MTTEGTPTGETSTAGQVSNDAPTVSTPPVTPPAVDAEKEELRKKADQAELRARQLENEKAARDKADAEAAQKQLEEQNEFKTLYERSQEQLNQLQTERETTAKQAAVNTAQQTVLTDYSAEVKDVAETAGLVLTDDTPEAQAAFKTKLDAIAAKFPNAPKPKVQGNNGNPTPPQGRTAEDAKLYQRMRFNDTAVANQAKMAVISKIPALNVMRKNAGLQVDE